MSKNRLFIDMDGTLAVFTPVDTLETLYEKGYYEKLKPIENVVQSVKSIMQNNPDIEVNILSAYLSDSKYALSEKNAWLDRFLPEISAENRIFMPCGEDKKNYIPGGVTNNDYLLDDYTHNLTLWEPPARGIKLLNGINHTAGTWEKDRIQYNRSPEKLAKAIVSVINGDHVYDNRPQDMSYNKNEIKEISTKEANEIITSREPRGLFYTRDNDGGYTAIDNTTGDAWTVNFNSLSECTVYLNGINLEDYKTNEGYIILDENKGYAFGYSPTAPDQLVLWHRDSDGDYFGGKYGSSFAVNDFIDIGTCGLDLLYIQNTLKQMGKTDYISTPTEDELPQYTMLLLSNEIQEFEQTLSQSSASNVIDNGYKLNAMHEMYDVITQKIDNGELGNEQLEQINSLGMETIYSEWLCSDYNEMNPAMSTFLDEYFPKHELALEQSDNELYLE